jgi:hypothetical protein
MACCCSFSHLPVSKLDRERLHFVGLTCLGVVGMCNVVVVVMVGHSVWYSFLFPVGCMRLLIQRGDGDES